MTSRGAKRRRKGIKALIFKRQAFLFPLRIKIFFSFRRFLGELAFTNAPQGFGTETNHKQRKTHSEEHHVSNNPISLKRREIARRREKKNKNTEKSERIAYPPRN